jgi:hypothetical protein
VSDELAVSPTNYELVHHWDEQIGLRCLRCHSSGRLPEAFWFHQDSTQSKGVPLADILAKAYRHEWTEHT